MSSDVVVGYSIPVQNNEGGGNYCEIKSIGVRYVAHKYFR
jgi:hypothetical protein